MATFPVHLLPSHQLLYQSADGLPPLKTSEKHQDFRKLLYGRPPAYPSRPLCDDPMSTPEQ